MPRDNRCPTWHLCWQQHGGSLFCDFPQVWPSGLNFPVVFHPRTMRLKITWFLRPGTTQKTRLLSCCNQILPWHAWIQMHFASLALPSTFCLIMDKFCWINFVANQCFEAFSKNFWEKLQVFLNKHSPPPIPQEFSLPVNPVKLLLCTEGIGFRMRWLLKATIPKDSLLNN